MEAFSRVSIWSEWRSNRNRFLFVYSKDHPNTELYFQHQLMKGDWPLTEYVHYLVFVRFSFCSKNHRFFSHLQLSLVWFIEHYFEFTFERDLSWSLCSKKDLGFQKTIVFFFVYCKHVSLCSKSNWCQFVYFFFKFYLDRIESLSTKFLGF